MYTPGGLYYNANLVGEGKKYEIPQTWDDMFKLGDQLKEEGKISLFTYAQAGYLDNTILSVIQEAGGQELLSKLLNYDAEAWNSKEGKMVTDTIGRLVKDYMEPNTCLLYTSGLWWTAMSWMRNSARCLITVWKSI